MIKGMHAMIYSSDAAELREFLRDKMGLNATDTGGGWLIFDPPEAELGCHPTNHENSPPSGTHDISFYCDDLASTMGELKERGVVFDNEPEDVGYGRAVSFTAPGGCKLQLYQPHYDK